MGLAQLIFFKGLGVQDVRKAFLQHILATHKKHGNNSPICVVTAHLVG